MTIDQTRIDIISLEQFRRTLDARLGEAQALLDTVTVSAATHPPLGTFADATLTSGDHAERHRETVERAQRLVAAVRAAQSATDVILTNYTTTEARNAASAAEIGSVLGGVDSALTGAAMVDKGRYSGMSHQQLYDALQAGSPGAVENTAAAWQSAAEQAHTLAASIRRDLDKLFSGWQSPAGTEYQSRVSKIRDFSDSLSLDLANSAFGLRQMSIKLRQARASADHPDEFDNNDKLLGGIVKGAAGGASMGLPGLVSGGAVGAIFGHKQDQEERERARERMAQLVTELANAYEVNRTSRWASMTSPPEGLPEGDVSAQASMGYVTNVSAPAAGPSLGTFGMASTATAGPAGPSTAAPVPTGEPVTATAVAAPQDVDPGSTGTWLTGAGGGVEGLAAAAGVVAAGAFGGQVAAALPVPGSATTAGLTAGVPAGGVLGAPLATSPASGTAAAPLRSATTVGRAPIGTPSQAAAGSRTVTGAPGNAPAHPPNTSRGPSAAAVGSTARRADEPDERTTWLTQDDMVWRDDSEVPPSVVGGA